jgi:DNA helicase-2/ATP-dependent DNA helicase PcrA
MAWKRKTATAVVEKPAPKKIVGSEQQEAIWDAMVNGDENITVKALAGTGKTTTKVEGMTRLCGKRLRLGAVAFNNPIAKEMQERMPSEVQACTMHSLGNSMVRRGFNAKLDKYKLDSILRDVIGGDPQADLEWREIELKKIASSLVSLVKNTEGSQALNASDQTYLNIIDHFGIEIPGQVSEQEAIGISKQAVIKCFEDTDTIDFDDMVWFPVVHDLSGEKFDLLGVDEAQDLNRCRQELCLKVAERMMIVGDKHQAIYGFTGSDVKSMETMGSELAKWANGHIVLPLTRTRRCPKAHVRLAQQIVPEFEAMDEAPEGSVGNLEFKDLIKEAKAGDLLICRMNAPVCQAAFKLLSLRKRVKIQGRDIGQGIISVIRKSKKDNVQDLLGWLTTWRDREEDRLRKRKRPSESALSALNDKYQCIIAFTSGCATVSEMVRVIEGVFSDDADAGSILLSSVHRAKGLEADRVVILCPEILPAPWAKKEWEKEQEMNLKYVALTRSKRELIFTPDWRRAKTVDTQVEVEVE